MFICYHKSPVLQILLFGYYFFSLACQINIRPIYVILLCVYLQNASIEFQRRKKTSSTLTLAWYKEQVEVVILTKILRTINVYWTFGLSHTSRQLEFVFDSTMLGVKLFGAIALCGLLAIVDVSQAFKTVCYYDGKALWRKGNPRSYSMCISAIN